MNFTGVPIIVICCYVLGEIFKACFHKNKQAYKLIPIILDVVGCILGIVIFYTNPEIILNANNIWVALGIGIVSGASSTGANQIIKQFFKKNETTNNDTN